MKAVRFHEYGGPGVLKLEEFDTPKLGRDDVLIAVRACALNHVDLDIRDGSSRLPISLPHTLGLEYAGVVESIGSEVSGIKVGDRVTALHQVHCGECNWCQQGQEESCANTQLFGVQLPGGYASHVIAPSRAIIPLPDTLSFEDAAAAQVTFSSAWHALKARANLQVNETVLVNAAGSGIGIAALQVARLLGGRVIVSAGSDEKISRAIANGAVAGVNYNSHDLAQAVLELTDGQGVNVVMESVGGDVLVKSIQALSQNGRLVTVGAHAGETVPVDVISLFRRQTSLLGSVRATVTEIQHVLNLVGDGIFKTEIHQRFPLHEAADAHEVLAKRANFGKVILVPELDS